VEQFVPWAESRGLKRRNLLIQRSHHLLESYLLGRIVYGMLNERAWIEFTNQEDPTVREALRVFRDGEAFPKAPEEKKNQEEI
jgi:carboxyl-terminal processing protease